MNNVLLWMLQILCAAIMIPFGYLKLVANQGDVLLFTDLGMEPHGRIIIGVIEVTAGILLLTRRSAATGSFLTVGVMLGAIIAHASVLGFDVLGDGGKHVMLLSGVLAASVIVTVVRRRELPLLGSSLE